MFQASDLYCGLHVLQYAKNRKMSSEVLYVPETIPRFMNDAIVSELMKESTTLETLEKLIIEHVTELTGIDSISNIFGDIDDPSLIFVDRYQQILIDHFNDVDKPFTTYELGELEYHIGSLRSIILKSLE